MDEYVVRQKIHRAIVEPSAPETLIQRVVLRAQAVAMGVKAQQQLETASPENIPGLVSRALIGQLAAVSELPQGVEPTQLAQQLEQQGAFRTALRGGNVARRLDSGEFLQQLVGQKPVAEEGIAPSAVPQKAGPSL